MIIIQLPENLEHAQEYGALRINADQDAYTVFELAESKIVNPLPSNFANDEEEWANIFNIFMHIFNK